MVDLGGDLINWIFELRANMTDVTMYYVVTDNVSRDISITVRNLFMRPSEMKDL
jgi:hypothetical protein